MIQRASYPGTLFSDRCHEGFEGDSQGAEARRQALIFRARAGRCSDAAISALVSGPSQPLAAGVGRRLSPKQVGAPPNKQNFIYDISKV